MRALPTRAHGAHKGPRGSTRVHGGPQWPGPQGLRRAHKGPDAKIAWRRHHTIEYTHMYNTCMGAGCWLVPFSPGNGEGPGGP